MKANDRHDGDQSFAERVTQLPPLGQSVGAAVESRVEHLEHGARRSRPSATLMYTTFRRKNEVTPRPGPNVGSHPSITRELISSSLRISSGRGEVTAINANTSSIPTAGAPVTPRGRPEAPEAARLGELQVACMRAEDRGDGALRSDRSAQVAPYQTRRPVHVLNVDRPIKTHFRPDRFELARTGVLTCEEQCWVRRQHTHSTEHDYRNGDETQGRVADAHQEIPAGHDCRLFSGGRVDSVARSPVY